MEKICLITTLICVARLLRQVINCKAMFFLMNISFASKELVLKMSIKECSDVHVSLQEYIRKSYSVSFTYESKYSSKELGSVENS
jgi:hypothetical protein